MSLIKEIGERQSLANENPWIRRHYLCVDYASESAAQVALNAQLVSDFGSPPSINALTLTNIQMKECGVGNWMADVTFGVYQRIYFTTGESQFNFEVSIQPVKVILSIEEQEIYKHPNDNRPIPSDIDRWLINDQGEGPEGVDIFEPIVSFSETHYVSSDILSQGYRNTLMEVVAKTNQSTFKGWASGEVLCSGISGSARGTSDWEIVYRFAARKNQTNLVIAGIPVSMKRGWDYLYPTYQTKHDEDAVVTLQTIQYIKVAKVFEETNFAALGIGS